jgi:AcrR family transcriptional regulator
MRAKDDFKRDALFNATVKLVNEIGFVSSSISKIAKEAKVSPATVYIHYKNKEDLLVSTYIEIKQKISKALLKDFNEKLPLRDVLRRVWLNVFKYISSNPQYFQYAEQFSNSPYAGLVSKSEVDRQFTPLIQAIQKGIDQKLIKDVHIDIIIAYIFYPIITLSNKRVSDSITINDDTVETAFNLAWDAIKL